MAGAGMVRAVVVALLVGGSYAKSLNLPADVDDSTATWTEAESSPWGGLVRCVLDPRPLDCVESRSQRAVDAMLAPGGRAASGDTALEPEIVEKVTELSETMVEAAASVMGRKIGLSEGSTDLVEEGRGKKKKKIHKLIALVKLVLLVLVVKLKLAFLMMALQTLFQFKLVVMVFLILITKKITLWATLKSKHQEAQKVIYYEHAQHQHHYDDHGGWSGGHDEHAESGHGGGWGNLWGRSYDTVPQTEHAAAAAASTSTIGVQSGVYRAADGSRIVIGQPDAQELAYAAQRP